MRSRSGGLVQAIHLMTCIPVRLRGKRDALFAHALPWLPVTGLIIGAGISFVAWAGTMADIWLGALFGLMFWFGVTGFLHADGLADIADGLGAAHGNKERLITVMKSPDIGSFGVLALVLLALSKLVLLALLLKHGGYWMALILIPAWARLGAVWWIRSLPPITSGMASVMKTYTSSHLIIIIALVLLLLTLVFAPALLLAPLLLYLWLLFLRVRFGGMNGDCLGAGIEVCEVIMLSLALVAMVSQ